MDIVAAFVAQHCPLSAIYAAIVAMDALFPNPEPEPDDFIVFSSSRTWSSKSCICWVWRSVRKAPSVPMTPRTPIPTKALKVKSGDYQCVQCYFFSYFFISGWFPNSIYNTLPVSFLRHLVYPSHVETKMSSRSLLIRVSIREPSFASHYPSKLDD